MDQITIAKHLLRSLQRMASIQLDYEKRDAYQPDYDKLIISSTSGNGKRLSENAYLCVKLIESIILSDQNGKALIARLSEKSNATSIDMEHYNEWALQVGWLLSVM